MFGYVTVCKECMSESDYEIFRAYYCGLCKEMGKQCSNLSRLGLSYDITFLAMVLSSIENKETEFKELSCIAHPLKKHKVAVGERSIEYAANMGVLLGYLKLKDDWEDDKDIKARLSMTVFKGGYKRAGKRYTETVASIEEQLRKLNVCEKENADIDEAADCFAKILEILFVPEFVIDETDKKILSWFGYNIGRWIYVIDAYNDMEEDYKDKNYNPFLVNFCGDIQELKKNTASKIVTSLTLNLETLSSTYELLKIYRNDAIIRHIVYMSLKAKQNKILGVSDESL